MKTRTFTTMGSLHPILFFAGVYIVALLASVFICSSLFYSCNSSAASISNQKTVSPPKPAGNPNTIALR